VRRLFLPTVVVAVAVVLDRGWLWPVPRETLLLQIHRGVCAAAFLLAWRFRRGGIAAAALLLAAAVEALRLAPPEGSGLALLLLPAVALLLPADLALLGLSPEWRVVSFAGLWRLGVLALQAGAVHLAATGDSPTAVAGRLRFRWLDLGTGWSLPQPALLAHLLAAAVLGVLLARRRRPIEAGLLGALAATFLAFEAAGRPLLFFAAGALILVLTQVESAFSLAFEDSLTGLPARRALEESLRHLGRRYAVAMVDVDHFKKLNDRHGHEVGDQVLRMVASRLSKVRGGGTAYRYGGEEFTVVFPGKTAAEVEPYLEELRRAIADRPFAVRGPTRPRRKPKKAGRGGGGKQLKVTVSLGAADRTDHRDQPEQVLEAADKALYRSKNKGRNRLTVS